MPRGIIRSVIVCLLLLTATVATVEAAGRPAYRGNVGSRIFHAPGCRHFSCKNCVVEFSSREEALKAGFRPCKVCRP